MIVNDGSDIDSITQDGATITVTLSDGTAHEFIVPTVQGPKGDKGDKGDTGVGVPEGGTAGQVLVKKSSTNYDTEWGTPAGGGDMLKSVYDTDNDGKVDSAENADTVDGHTVAKDVPADAKFTDTVYDDTEIRGEIPSKTSDLTNDSGFITKAVNDLVNYYLKSETYSKTEVDDIVTAIKNSRFEVVATLPTTDIETNVIYLVPKDPAQTSNVKDEYINLDGTTSGWEKIGDTEIDLSGYVTTQALNTALAAYTTTADLTTLLAGKQDTLTFDNAPTENSNNPVKSGGVYAADDKIYQVMGQNSAKNFIPFDLDKIKAKNTTGTWNGNVYSLNGIDFTFNSDGTVDASGTATETASVHYYDPVGLPPFGGDRILRLTGCPSGGSNVKYKLMAYRVQAVDGSTGTAEDYGEGINLKWINDGSGTKGCITLSVYVGAGTVDMTFKPMLRLASDTDNTYQPYAKTNQELTAENEALTNQVKAMNNVYGAKNVLDLTPRLKKNVPATYITSFSNDGIVLNGTVDSSTTLRINPAEDDNSFVLPQGTYVLSHKDGPSPSRTSITLRKNGTNITTNNRLAAPYEFEANGTDYFTVLFHVDAVTFNNAVVCPMICLKSFYELDTSFEPYAKTNQELTQDTTALLDNLEVNGAVNMLPNTAITQTINGVTFTVNDDGTIDVSGTATANANLVIGSFNVKAGTQYTISDGIGTLEHDDVAGVMYATSVPAQGEAAWYWRTDYIGAPVDRRTAIANYDAVVTATIRIPSGATVNYKFKPMFTLASYNEEYVPYAKSNRELTEELTVKSGEITRLVSFSAVTSYGIRKYGKVVELYFAGTLSEAVNTWTDFLTVPEGFRPSHYVQIVSFNTYSSCKNLQLAPSGGIQSASNLSSGDFIRFSATYIID